MDDNKNNKTQNSAKYIKTFVMLCIAVLLLSVSFIIERSGVWESLFEVLHVSSIYEESNRYPLSVTVYDVGNANCVLVRCDGYNVLIDSGYEKVQNSISDNLRALRINKLDLVILSSPDKKYIGDMCGVADNVQIDKFVTCDIGDTDMTEAYTSLAEKLKEKNIVIEYAKSGDEYVFGDMNLRIVSPYKVYDTMSDNSVVVRLSYGEFGMLFMGDVSKRALGDIVDTNENIRCDVLLAARQGRSGAVTDEFLRIVNPAAAVVCVEQTDYIPDDVTIQKIIDYGCKLYRTDYSGDIIIASSGKDYKILTQFN